MRKNVHTGLIISFFLWLMMSFVCIWGSHSMDLFQVLQQQIRQVPAVCPDQPALTEDDGHGSRQHRYIHQVVFLRSPFPLACFHFQSLLVFLLLQYHLFIFCLIHCNSLSLSPGVWYEVITFGAPSDHHQAFRHGGLGRLLSGHRCVLV